MNHRYDMDHRYKANHWNLGLGKGCMDHRSDMDIARMIRTAAWLELESNLCDMEIDNSSCLQIARNIDVGYKVAGFTRKEMTKQTMEILVKYGWMHPIRMPMFMNDTLHLICCVWSLLFCV